jgi:hypothetical protein
LADSTRPTAPITSTGRRVAWAWPPLLDEDELEEELEDELEEAKPPEDELDEELDDDPEEELETGGLVTPPVLPDEELDELDELEDEPETLPEAPDVGTMTTSAGLGSE